jgi:hypothetical protein
MVKTMILRLRYSKSMALHSINFGKVRKQLHTFQIIGFMI